MLSLLPLDMQELWSFKKNKQDISKDSPNKSINLAN